MSFKLIVAKTILGFVEFLFAGGIEGFLANLLLFIGLPVFFIGFGESLGFSLWVRWVIGPAAYWVVIATVGTGLAVDWAEKTIRESEKEGKEESK